MYELDSGAIHFYSLFVKQIVNIVEGPKLIDIIHEVVYVCSRHLSMLLVTTTHT